MSTDQSRCPSPLDLARRGASRTMFVPVPAPRRSPEQVTTSRASGTGKTDSFMGVVVQVGSRSVTISDHVLQRVAEKGLTLDQVRGALTSPEKITDVRRYPGQKRYCGCGVAVVVSADGTKAVTCYLDGIRTPLRPDQMDDPAALASRRALRA